MNRRSALCPVSALLVRKHQHARGADFLPGCSRSRVRSMRPAPAHAVGIRTELRRPTAGPTTASTNPDSPMQVEKRQPLARDRPPPCQSFDEPAVIRTGCDGESESLRYRKSSTWHLAPRERCSTLSVPPLQQPSPALHVFNNRLSAAPVLRKRSTIPPPNARGKERPPPHRPGRSADLSGASRPMAPAVQESPSTRTPRSVNSSADAAHRSGTRTAGARRPDRRQGGTTGISTPSFMSPAGPPNRVGEPDIIPDVRARSVNSWLRRDRIHRRRRIGYTKRPALPAHGPGSLDNEHIRLGAAPSRGPGRCRHTREPAQPVSRPRQAHHNLAVRVSSSPRS